MNPYSGEMERFAKPEYIPKGWLELTEAEAREYSTLPHGLRLERYIKNHFSQSCPKCNKFVGNHSLRRFRECAANAFAEIDIARHAKELGDVFDSLPARNPMEDLATLRSRVNELEEAFK